LKNEVKLNSRNCIY